MSKRRGIVAELSGFVTHSKAYWMVPILAALLLFAVFLSAGSSSVAPFIYTLF